MLITLLKIIVDNSTAELKNSALGECVLKISLKNAAIDEVRKRFSGKGDTSECIEDISDKGIIHLKLRCGTDPNLREDLYKIIKATDWILLEFHQETLTLENIFQELTRG